MKHALLGWLLLFLPPVVVRCQSPAPGQALAFQGAGLVSVRHRPELNPFPLTVTAWIKTTQTTGTAGLVNKYLSGAFCGWQLYLINGEVRAWYFADFTNHVWDGADGLNGGPVADDRWHHLAFTVDADGGVLYVDGVPTAARVWSGTPTRTAGGQDVSLGAYPGASPNLYRGLLDEVTIWNLRLPRAAVEELARGSLRGDEPGLVAYYRLDESAGPLVQDSSPLGGRQAGLITGSVGRIPSTIPWPPPAPTNGLPVIARLPSQPDVEAGLPVSFTVLDAGGTWQHQWSRDDEVLPAATNATLILPAASPADAGDYRVRSWNDSQSVTSLPVPLRVLTAPELVTQPVGQLADVGATVTFAPVVLGGRPLAFRWFRDGSLLDVPDTNVLTLAPVRPADAADYQLVAANSFGSVTSAVARLNVVTRALTDSLVLHLPLDGQFDDRSGRGNHAAYVHSGPNARTAPTFSAGRIGQAFQVTTASDGSRFEYATLGYPPDLRLGAEDDFSVSFWVNYVSQTGDLPFLSNKDWDKSHKPGWAITTQRGGNFRLNASGPNLGKDFFTTATTPVIRDGRWHHLVFSFQRAADGQSAHVYLYADGVLINRTPTFLAGTIDTFGLPFTHASPRPSPQSAWALNLGQDGTGVYFDQGGASATGARLDDLGIWRRALTPEEVKAIHAAGLSGLNLAQAVVAPRLFIAPAAPDLLLFWSGDPANRLQTSSGLPDGPWSEPAVAAGVNSLTLPVTDLPAFFRVIP